MTTLVPPLNQYGSPAGHGQAAVTDAVALVDATQHRPLPSRQSNLVAPPNERTETHPTDADPAVDIMALLGRCLGNFELIVRVLARFRKTGAADLEQLSGSIVRSDFVAVVEVSHRFKGAAGNISAAGLHKLAASMEQSGRNQNAAELPDLLAQLTVEWERFLRYADAFAPPVGAAQVRQVPVA